MACIFKKEFKEPDEVYTCMSTSLFYKTKYVKVGKTGKIKDVHEEKAKSFITNLSDVVKKLYNGYYPSNYYLRIYYDDSIFENQYMTKLYEVFKKYDKIQFVKYECPEYYNTNTNTNTKTNVKSDLTGHMGLFGTMMRFYTIFDPESTNMDCCILTDADNVYTNNFIEIVETFKKSNNKVLTINRIPQIAFYSLDKSFGNKKANMIHMLGGATIIKRDPMFINKNYWEKYVDEMFNNNGLILMFNYNDFKRFGLFCGSQMKDDSYYSFNYGFDEIWLNYVIKTILHKTDNITKIAVYFTKDSNIKFLLDRLMFFLKYNNEKNKRQLNKFISDCTFLNPNNKNNKTYDSLIRYIKFLKPHQYSTFFDEFKRNKYINKIYIQNNIKYIIRNYKTLMKERGKYNYRELLQSKY